MITVAVLGPVEVNRDGQRVVVPSGKTTELLLRLALAAGTTVRTERLIEDLWADDAVAVGKNTLQSKVSQLRRALGNSSLVVGGSAGYALAIEPDAVDALEVARHADIASALRQAGDAKGALSACSSALAMFRGESLFGASDADWLQPHRAQLEGVRLRLIEDQLGARIDLGATGEVVGDLEDLVGKFPLREGFWALLITALYRDNRQADALAAYRRLREHLAEELGLDPSPELQSLEQQVLLQDPVLRAPARQPSLSVDLPTGGNLPELSSSIVARERELTEIRDLMTQQRLVTLVGAAGVGKTRLAIEVARNSSPRDGAWLVRLETAQTGASVNETVAVAIRANGASESSFFERLRGAEVLVILDNCEHVIDSAVEVTELLLSAGSGVQLLATSQLPLGIDGEHVYPVEPLTVAASVTLFNERAVERNVTLDDEATASVEQVCRSLDGLPLAIELAAARTKSLSIQEISRRLADRFALLSDPTSRRPSRRRALSAAIAWSYDLLFPDDQRGLWALACFVGGAPLPAVEYVLHALDVPAKAAVDVVGRLADRSLVSFDAGADGAVRYRLLDSLRTFALDRLNETGNTDTAMAAHAAWVAASAELAADGVLGPEQPRHVGFARTERANIDAALAWASSHDPSLGLRIASNLGWVWVVLGDGSGAQRVRAALVAAGDDVPAKERIIALLSIAWLEASAGSVESSHEALAQASELAEALDDGYLRAKTQFYLAYWLSQQGRFAETLDLLSSSRIAFRELAREWDEAGNWVLTSHCANWSGDSVLANAACEESARLLARIRDPWLLVHTEAMLGAVAQAEQRFADACDHLGRAAAAAADAGFAATNAYHLANLGRAEQQVGDLDAAARTLNQSIEAARDTGDLRVATLAQVRLGRVLRALGDDEASVSTLEAAQTWYRLSGGGEGARLADCVLAAIAARSDIPEGTSSLNAVLADAGRAGDVEVEILALDALARLNAEAGDLTSARELLDAADRLMPSAQHLVVDSDRIDAAGALRVIST